MTMQISSFTGKELAVMFHDTYERLAPKYGYETREETREFDELSRNGQLMIATCDEIIKALVNELMDGRGYADVKT